MSIPEAAMLSEEQKSQLQEIADLMLQIYQTMAQMRYVQPGGIIEGPHDISKMRKEYAKHNLDPAIIYLYHILPYIDTALADASDFFQGGAFFNQLDARDGERGRDPCYASPTGVFEDEDGEYMLPWYTPLSNCGNHSSIIIYDAREHRIWIVDQIERDSRDPVFCKGWYAEVKEEKEESDWGSGESAWEDEDGEEAEDSGDDAGSVGSSDFWEDEDDDKLGGGELEGLREDQNEKVEWDEGFEVVEEISDWERREAMNLKNQNSLELTRSRDASDVLRDINQYYRELKELPGQGEYTGGEWMKPKTLRPLYLKNGWPDNFDGEAFDMDMIRAYCSQRAKYFAEEPLRRVQCNEGWAEHSARDIERYEKEVADASDVDRKWLAEFELWKAYERSERDDRDLAEVKKKAEELCPHGKCQKDEDLPLWELEMLRVEYQWKQERIFGKGNNRKAAYNGDEESIRHMQIQRERNKKRATLYGKAFEACQADAERLCPGRTFEEATGIKSLGRPDTLSNIERSKASIRYSKAYQDKLEVFAVKIPNAATAARNAVKAEVEK